MTLKNTIQLINLLLIIWFVFYQNKNYRIQLKWLLLFLLMPLFSFVLYFFLGMGIKMNKKKYQEVRKRVNHLFETKPLKYQNENQSIEKIVKLNTSLGGEELSKYNKIDFLCDGNSYFNSLFYDISKAKYSIFIEMYIFRDDRLGKELLDLLIRKANENIKVKILYEPNGNLKNRKGFFSKCKHKNIQVVKYNSFLYSLRNFNYRNHKKIIIIDGKVAYLGGFNIGEEYLSLNKHISPFRDTGVRLIGEIVNDILKEFLIDFYYAYYLINPNFYIDVKKDDLTKRYVNNNCLMQLMSSSYNIRENIRRSKLFLLTSAKKEVYIQSPYFIIDERMNEELKLLILSGVVVHIMIPLKYDQLIPFSASLWGVRELYSLGAKIYLYEGFIHAKSLIIDDLALVIGSANFDIRSFSLNLESDLFIYEQKEVLKYKEIYKEDIKHSLVYSIQLEEILYKHMKLGKRIFRLLSSIL